jgi:CheY-like chemotaxis protein
MPHPEEQGQGGLATERAPIAVFLVDDVPEMRELIRLGMGQDPGFEIVGEASDGRSAVDGITATRPAAVLLDLSIPAWPWRTGEGIKKARIAGRGAGHPGLEPGTSGFGDRLSSQLR